MKKIISILLTVLVLFALTSTVLAETIRPSVGEDHAPDVVVDPEGYYGIMFIDGEIIGYLDEDDISIIPYSLVDDASEALEAQMKSDFAALSGAESLDSMLTDKSLDDVAKALDSDKSAADLQVSDLFGIEFSDEVKEKNPDNIRVTIDPKSLEINGTVPSMFYKTINADIWSYFTDKITTNEDGTLTFDIDMNGGSIVCLALKADESTDPGVDEPGTDEPGTDVPGTNEPGDEPGDDSRGTGKHCTKLPHWIKFLCPLLCVGPFCACWYVPVIILLIIIYIVYRKLSGKDEEEDTDSNNEAK